MQHLPLCPGCPEPGSRVLRTSCRNTLTPCPQKLPGCLDSGTPARPGPGRTNVSLPGLSGTCPRARPCHPHSTRHTTTQGRAGHSSSNEASAAVVPPRVSALHGSQILPRSPEAQPVSPVTDLPPQMAHARGAHKGPRGTHVSGGPHRTRISGDVRGPVALLPSHTCRGTYVIDEVGDVSRAGGEQAGGLGAHAAQRGVSAQRRPSQGVAQGSQLCRVAQLVDVIGVLGTKGVERSPDLSQVGFLPQTPCRGKGCRGRRPGRTCGPAGGPPPGPCGCPPALQGPFPPPHPDPPNLVLFSAPLFVVVENVVPEVVLQPVQKSLVRRRPPRPCDEGHRQGQH